MRPISDEDAVDLKRGYGAVDPSFGFPGWVLRCSDHPSQMNAFYDIEQERWRCNVCDSTPQPVPTNES